jgi:hypothetical protein
VNARTKLVNAAAEKQFGWSRIDLWARGLKFSFSEALNVHRA